MTELEKVLGVAAMQELRDLIRAEVQDAMQGTLTNLDAPVCTIDPATPTPKTLTKAQKSLVDCLTSPIVLDEPGDPAALASYDPYSEFDPTCVDKFSDQEERTEGGD